jgi:hypothetical protein
MVRIEMKNVKPLIVLLISLIGLVWLNPHASVAAPEHQGIRPGKPIQVRADPNVDSVRIPAPAQFAAARAPAMTVNVNYSPTPRWGDVCGSWSPQAQTAFSYAASIWGALFYSPVPVTIDACWATNLGAGVLGHGGPLGFYRNFTGAPVANTWYPVALANSRRGADLDPSSADIYLALSSTFSWYLGTDGATPAGQYDLVTVALHEIGHGLGFLGSMELETGYGECGSPTGYGCWGWDTNPAIYDRFAQDSAGNSLINTGVYPNPSLALGNALKSNAVYFSGTNANAANGSTRVPLYAPSSWSPGSSYAHLDYNTYRYTINRLMVYAISSGSSIHDPGPVTNGIMKDIGWQPAACYTLTTSVNPGGTGSIAANPAPNCNGTQYSAGTNVTLTANPSTGYAFSSWSGDASGSTNPTTITMNANKSVTANFIVQCYTLTRTVNPSGGGSVGVNPAPNCNGTQYNAGTNVTLTATANSGYFFFLWGGDLGGTTNPANVTMNSHKTITAYFSTPLNQFNFLPLIRK